MKKNLIYGVSILIFLLIIFNFDFDFNSLIYVSNIFFDQVNLVLKSEDIDKVILRENLDESIREQLKFVPEVMKFGDKSGFPKTRSYSKYIQLDRKVFLYSLSASSKSNFENYMWKWPFIGDLPYKGFIHLEDALEEESKLKDKGYDTYLGESTAMSTLGIFPDPIITSMINKNDSITLINTIFHERTHQLFYKKNEVVFNENSAVLLELLTTLDFVKENFGEDSEEYKKQVNRIQDTLIFSEFIDSFYEELNVLYSSDLTNEAKIIEREKIFEKNIDDFKIIKERLYKFFKRFDQNKVNNAYILSDYRYYGKVHKYYQVYKKLGKDLQKTIKFFDDVANSKEKPDVLINNFLEKTN